MPPLIDEDLCTRCGACVIECPVEAIALRIPLPMMVCYK